MHFEYSPHALKRLRERGVTRRDVQLTILHPDYMSRGDRGRILSKKTIGPHVLEVIYVLEGNSAVIITTYFV